MQVLLFRNTNILMLHLFNWLSNLLFWQLISLHKSLFLLHDLDTFKESFRLDDVSANHTVKGNVPKDAIPYHLEFVLFSHFHLHVVLIYLLMVDNLHLRLLDENQLLQLVDVAEIHAHLHNLIVREICPIPQHLNHTFLPLFILLVVVRTLGTTTALALSAWLSLIEHRVILLLLPPVAILTTGLVWATFRILGDEETGFPMRAQLVRVLENVGFSSEVLPIMRINALGLIVLFVVRAPLGFEVVNPEVVVTIHRMDKSRLQALGRVGKRTVVTILTLADLLRVPSAIFGFVLLRMINRFDTIVT